MEIDVRLSTNNVSKIIWGYNKNIAINDYNEWCVNEGSSNSVTVESSEIDDLILALQKLKEII